MAPQDNNSNPTIMPAEDINIKGARKLTPLDLNGIKLDPRHTLLTPSYLSSLDKE